MDFGTPSPSALSPGAHEHTTATKGCTSEVCEVSAHMVWSHSTSGSSREGLIQNISVCDGGISGGALLLNPGPNPSSLKRSSDPKYSWRQHSETALRRVRVTCTGFSPPCDVSPGAAASGCGQGNTGDTPVLQNPDTDASCSATWLRTHNAQQQLTSRSNLSRSGIWFACFGPNDDANSCSTAHSTACGARYLRGPLLEVSRWGEQKTNQEATLAKVGIRSTPADEPRVYSFRGGT